MADFPENPGLEPHRAYKVIDAWLGKSLGCRKDKIIANVQSHDTAVFLTEEGCGCYIDKGAKKRTHGVVQRRWRGLKLRVGARMWQLQDLINELKRLR